jgi:hypothetical protein
MSKTNRTKIQSNIDAWEIANKQVLQLQKIMVMSPQDFSYRWGLNSEELANICGISKPTTYHWLCGQKSHRTPTKACQRIMAMTDFMLENSEIIYPLIQQWLDSRKHS